MPNMTGYVLLTILAGSTFFSCRAMLANVRVALVFTVSFTVGGCIIQYLVLRANDTIVILIINIFVPGVVSFLGHWSFVGH